MDRRLKVYREQNVHDSGNSVQCFFTKFIGRDNVEVVNAFEEESKNASKIQKFIERNGKPCCLNLITDKDVKFLKSIEKKSQKDENDHKDSESHKGEDNEEDEIYSIIKREEAEAKRRQDEENER